MDEDIVDALNSLVVEAIPEIVELIGNAAGLIALSFLNANPQAIQGFAGGQSFTPPPAESAMAVKGTVESIVLGNRQALADVERPGMAMRDVMQTRLLQSALFTNVGYQTGAGGTLYRVEPAARNGLIAALVSGLTSAYRDFVQGETENFLLALAEEEQIDAEGEGDAESEDEGNGNGETEAAAEEGLSLGAKIAIGVGVVAVVGGVGYYVYTQQDGGKRRRNGRRKNADELPGTGPLNALVGAFV